MYRVESDGLGPFFLPDEFISFCGPVARVEVWPTTAAPSAILRRLAEGNAVLLTGEYRYADAIYHYCAHFASNLVQLADLSAQPWQERHAQRAQVKRLRLHRLLFAACSDDLLLMRDAPSSLGLRAWLAEDTGARAYLIPMRRYQRIRADMQRAQEGIYYDFLDVRLTIRPFVYIPADDTVPAMFLQYESLFSGKKVLDMGTGTGILAILAAKMHAHTVLATDISPYAVACARENVRALGLLDIVRVPDAGTLFVPVRDDVFDVILFNAPWIQGEPKTLYDCALYDSDYRVINRFLSEAPGHLAHDGCILLQYSDASQRGGDGSIDNLHSSLEKNRLAIEAQTSILRNSRSLNAMEQVSIFKIRKLL
ncbi:MAG: 50S ribosomal protein L11 methyltransferase [Anaerolineae bacterium]